MNAAVDTVKVPGLAVAYLLIEYQRLVLCKYAHCVYTRIYAVRQRKVDNTIFCAEWHCGLCNVLSQGIKSAALSACKKHSHTFFFVEHKISPTILLVL